MHDSSTPAGHAAPNVDTSASTIALPVSIAAPAVEQSSRRSILSRAVFTGLATVPVVSLLTSRSEAYTGSQSKLDANAIEAFRDIKKHENDHVAFLKTALGAAARPKPKFTSKLKATNFSQFVSLSQAFEVTGVGAYLAAAPAISSKDYLAAAASIALVEARHAGFLNVFVGKDVTSQAKDGKFASFDKPLTIKEVVTAVSPFIASLNGGPAASFTAGDDISILNFALLLEYLEAEFYNINTEKYVGKD